MSDPTNSDHDDDERYPRRRRASNPFDDFFNNFMSQFGGQFGNFNFDSMFDQMDFFLEDMFRRLGIQNVFNGDPTTPGFVWGFRVTRGEDGRPRIERFGNTPRRVPGSQNEYRPSNEREPLTDVIEDIEVVRVIAEIPGVRKQNIDLSATDNSLLIQAESDDSRRKYYKELNLPCAVIPDSAAAKFNNGVLEVELKKQAATEPKGTKVKIDWPEIVYGDPSNDQ